jgi:hypothetical protein
MKSSPVKRSISGTDRRSGVDRRQVDKDPPGHRERRRHVEARKPEVVELDLSDSDWAALTKAHLQARK